jgi:hypothetical protein
MRELLIGAILLLPGLHVDDTESRLYSGIDRFLTIPSTVRGDRHRHWGSKRWPEGRCDAGPGGCHARVQWLTRAFIEAGNEHGVDPFILAGIAASESAFNPLAEGSAGERSMMQLSKRHRNLHAFMSSERTRTKCLGKLDMCHGSMIDRAARIIAKGLELCGGIRPALRRYNSGRCESMAAERYARRVMRAAAMLRGDGEA